MLDTRILKWNEFEFVRYFWKGIGFVYDYDIFINIFIIFLCTFRDVHYMKLFTIQGYFTLWHCTTCLLNLVNILWFQCFFSGLFGICNWPGSHFCPRNHQSPVFILLSFVCEFEERITCGLYQHRYLDPISTGTGSYFSPWYSLQTGSDSPNVLFTASVSYAGNLHLFVSPQTGVDFLFHTPLQCSTQVLLCILNHLTGRSIIL